MSIADFLNYLIWLRTLKKFDDELKVLFIKPSPADKIHAKLFTHMDYRSYLKPVFLRQCALPACRPKPKHLD